MKQIGSCLRVMSIDTVILLIKKILCLFIRSTKMVRNNINHLSFVPNSMDIRLRQYVRNLITVIAEQLTLAMGR